ncbi:MAG: ABC transporter permease subunit [Myxococcaceae bacterium]|nr:ABC transporter permease subunit [Myxococcaceae bacterium]
MLLLTVVLAATPVLKWGADAQGGAPYVFQDPMDPNHLIGFEVELAGELAKRMGMEPHPVHGAWDKLLELLARGDFDVAINGIEVAEEKKRVALLSRPYFTAPERLTVRKGDQNAPRSLAELKGRTVGTLPGSLAERIATNAGAEVKTYEGGQDEIYDDLKLKRTDAVLLDGPVSIYYGFDEALEDAPGDYGKVDYAVGVRLDEPELLLKVNAALDSMEADGTLAKLYARWGIGEGNGAPSVELEKWRAAVGKPLPFLERVTTRYPAVLPLFAKGAALTLAVSLLAMVLAIMLGLTLATGRRYGPAPVKAFCVAYIELFRGTPLLVQLTLVYFGLPELGLKLSPFVAGVVALALNYAAAEAENYRAGLESVPAGQLEASSVLGLTRWQTLRFVVGPQAVRVSIPPMTNDFIALLKDSSLVSIVTLTELTKTYTNLASSMRDHLGLGLVVAACYLIIGLPFALLARRVEAYFGRHLKKATT